MAKRGRRGDAAKARRWRELVKRWQQSGQTVRQFCRAAEVKESAFYWWKRRLVQCRTRRGEDRQGADGVLPKKPTEMMRTGPAGRHEAARFLPVQLVMARPGSGVEIHWDNGRSVRLARGFDRQTLADALAVLEAWPC